MRIAHWTAGLERRGAMEVGAHSGAHFQLGARKVSQLQDNLASLDLELSAEQLKSLDGPSQIELGFPQSIYEREMVRGVRYGGMWDRLVVDGGMLAQ